MMLALYDPVVDLALRASLALLFATAGAHKARDIAGFCRVVEQYRIVPHVWLRPVTAAVIGSELLIAGAILWPPGRHLAAIAMVTILGVYSTAIAVNLARGRREIDCGCGGPGQRLSGWLVVRNAALMAAALVTLVPPTMRPMVWLDWLTLAGVVGVLATSWAAGHRLLAAEATVRVRAMR